MTMRFHKHGVQVYNMDKPCERCGGDHAESDCFFRPDDPAIPSNMLISRRGYFAGLAMQTLLSKCWFDNFTTSDGEVLSVEIAHNSLIIADALIKELDKK